MPHPNPTPIRVGMNGTFLGKRYRVEGRVVMSTEADGQTWFWNEFNLVTTSGESATLVHEDYGDGPAWKLFTDLYPPAPITASEAAARKVGDIVHLTGNGLPVTQTGTSVVAEIEGRAPEGVETGDVASFLNAEGPGQFVVASWTGTEIEFYRGRHLGTNAVAEAFQLAASSLGPGTFGDRAGAGTSPGRNPMRWIAPAVAITVLLVILANAPASCRSGGRVRQDVIAHVAAPDCDLRPGQRGRVAGVEVRILSRARVEVAEVGRTHEHHEFLLEGPDGTRFLLLSGWAAPGGDWLFCRETTPRTPLKPTEAAALAPGATVQADGMAATVTTLFRNTGVSLEGEPSPGLLPNPGTVHYGLLARSGPEVILARWDAKDIRWHHGQAIPAAGIQPAFHSAPPP